MAQQRHGTALPILMSIHVGEINHCLKRVNHLCSDFLLVNTTDKSSTHNVAFKDVLSGWHYTCVCLCFSITAQSRVGFSARWRECPLSPSLHSGVMDACIGVYTVC